MKHRCSPMLSLFFALFISLPCIASSAASEKALISSQVDRFVVFLDSGTPGKLEGKDGIELSYRYWLHQGTQPIHGTIILINGYSESLLQYGETLEQLFQAGFDLFAMDHRGMGLSGRMLPNPQIVHVEHFSDYVEDQQKFLHAVVQKQAREKSPLFLLAHSTGGLVGSYLAAKNPDTFRAIVFTSPLLKINTGVYPEWLALGASQLFSALGFGDHYTIGYGDFHPEKAKPEDSKVTHSRERALQQIELYARYPRITMGGPSYHWVQESILATHGLDRVLPDPVTDHGLVKDAIASPVLLQGPIKNPLLILQAGDDHFVVPARSQAFCQNTPNCRIQIFPQGYHSLLLEKDDIRAPVLNGIIKFFNRPHETPHVEPERDVYKMQTSGS